LLGCLSRLSVPLRPTCARPHAESALAWPYVPPVTPDAPDARRRLERRNGAIDGENHTVELLCRPLLMLRMTLLEFWQHFLGKEFQRGHDVLVFPVPALGDKQEDINMARQAQLASCRARDEVGCSWKATLPTLCSPLLAPALLEATRLACNLAW